MSWSVVFYFRDLNSTHTPVLAVQNMDASGTVAKTQEIEFRALEGSLSMMSKGLPPILPPQDVRAYDVLVLNDVLDL